MPRRRFSKPPSLGAGSRAPKRLPQGELSPEVQQFKDVYVHERRVLERFRNGDVRQYIPAPSLDGKSKWDTPEERKSNRQNKWELYFHKLQKAQSYANPTFYVRILFRILRGSSLSIPTLLQLTTPNMIELVGEYLQDHVQDVRQQFVAESERAESAILLNQRGAGYPLALSVYYAIVDERLDLSPLFKYCLATETVETLRQKGVELSYCEKLENLAKQYELLAAMDYTLFPDDYDRVWGKSIPESFRVAACELLEAAVKQ